MRGPIWPIPAKAKAWDSPSIKRPAAVALFERGKEPRSSQSPDRIAWAIQHEAGQFDVMPMSNSASAPATARRPGPGRTWAAITVPLSAIIARSACQGAVSKTGSRRRNRSHPAVRAAEAPDRGSAPRQGASGGGEGKGQSRITRGLLILLVANNLGVCPAAANGFGPERPPIGATGAQSPYMLG